MVDAAPPSPNVARLDAVVAAHGARATELVQILRDAQALDGWLPPATITYLAHRLRLPRARVEGVAGFYAFLHLTPAGRYRVLFSDNVTDRMAGSPSRVAGIFTRWFGRSTSDQSSRFLNGPSMTRNSNQFAPWFPAPFQ